VSGEKALKLGLQVIAKITGYADSAQVHKTFKYVLQAVLNSPKLPYVSSTSCNKF